MENIHHCNNDEDKKENKDNLVINGSSVSNITHSELNEYKIKHRFDGIV